MERKNTLMIFTLASVLVLAVFSANEKAYAGPPVIPQDGLGDFYCFDTLSPAFSSSSFLIEDQFDTVTNDDWEQLEYCTAANKNFQGDDFVSPFDDGFPNQINDTPLNQHYQGWLYPALFDGDALNQQVELFVPQFDHTFEATIEFYDSILVPATKFNPSQQDSANMNHHWNCYGISGGTSLGQSAVITTQHGDSIEDILNPFLMCAPMIKDNQFFPDEGLDGPHMVCYDLSPIDRTNVEANEQLPNALNDQVEGFVSFVVNDVEKFCAPAFKNVITPPTVGGSDVSINTSALLLAGVSSVSMWMIPVVIAGIGIGVFVIKRRN